MRYSTLLKMMRWWPPFLGAGIRVESFGENFDYLIVRMKLRFWNQNYVGTHFGGSLYAMTDPFYMLLLIKKLGKDYVVWDKSASIRYKKPAKGIVYARFEVSEDLLISIRAQVQEEGKAEPVFIVPITDSEGEIVAEVKKVLSIKKK